MKYRTCLLFSFIFLFFFGYRSAYSQNNVVKPRYIEVSKVNPAYFSFSDGSPYIPVGINLINPSSRTHENPDSAFHEMEQWMKNLADNGGNYIRVWLSESFWDMEDKVAGKYNDEKLKRIDRFIEMARKYKLRIKITLEHFRSVTLEENAQKWATKFVYHTSNGGPLDSIRQYLTSSKGQQLFLNKIDFYQKRYGSDSLFFGWELWNEMNAMKGPEDSIFFAWNEKMLGEVKQRFPENLVMQSLGSFDNDNVRPVYKKMMLLPGNEIAQVHRYLDAGAKMEICQAPMDIICSSAVEELLSYHTGKPVILAETGAVEPGHAGPSKYYPLDTAGILLHDILFAPFFAGSAGAGMSWHWDSYVHKNNLWYHFKRFNEAIKGINPIKEKFIPAKAETTAVRIYLLKGKKTTLLWLRDKTNNWESELQNGIAPATLHGIQINFRDLGLMVSPGNIEVYDPWKNSWTRVERAGQVFILPDFKRSIVIRIASK
jgi:Cellulase (glycosyl hydrolase family 5)